ncbi:hypothetical protein FXO37_09355 [Capsicum annuum]|nr:hypothetical protein FXO37_09355 [Capsicum annuum]
MATPPNLEEGQSITRSPQFNELYYGWWKTRMHDFIMVKDNVTTTSVVFTVDVTVVLTGWFSALSHFERSTGSYNPCELVAEINVGFVDSKIAFVVSTFEMSSVDSSTDMELGLLSLSTKRVVNAGSSSNTGSTGVVESIA